MADTYVRDFYGVILGVVEDRDNGDQIFRAFPSRQILGYYRKSIDRTTDFYGRILSKGNTGISLIYEKK